MHVVVVVAGLVLVAACGESRAEGAPDLAADVIYAGGDIVTIIHSPFVRPDRLEKYAASSMTPSFFTAHASYFADTHMLNRGKEAMFFLSPMRAAIDKGLRPTDHTDFVVTPLEALQAITINAADQYGAKNSKGSLEPGKLADLVVLDGNPLKVDRMAIKDI